MSNVTKAGLDPLPHPGPVPPRRSGLGVLGWIVGLLVIGGMGISILLPSLCKAREPVNRAKCASNLHQIGLAILLYTQDNGGQYPSSLSILPKEEQITSAVMVCPSSNDESSSAVDTTGIVADLHAAESHTAGHKHCLSYIYVGRGLNTATASPATIVAYEPLDNHAGEGTNVLFGDGHAEWIDRTAWPNVAAAAGVAVVQSSTTRP